MTSLTTRIITAAERRQMVPYSDMHVWRLEKAGKFPKRIKLGANRVGWLLSEFEDWIARKVAERG
jgi:prophage regulatory protein